MERLLEYVNNHWGRVRECASSSNCRKEDPRFLCGACHEFSYCSKECGATHWEMSHKLECIGGSSSKKRGRPKRPDEITLEQFSELPKEVVMRMTEFLNGDDLKSFRQTSKAAEVSSRRAYFAKKPLTLRGTAALTWMPTRREEQLLAFTEEVRDKTGGEALFNLKRHISRIWNVKRLDLEDRDNRPLNLNYAVDNQYLEQLTLTSSVIDNFMEISKLTRLRILAVYGLGNTSLPRNIFETLNLQRLDLVECEFTELPESFCNLRNLEHLEIGDGELRVIPECIQRFTKLKILYLFKNNAGMTLPDAIFQLMQLETLFLNGMTIPALSVGFGSLINLKKLNIYGCGLQEFPDSVGRFRRLEVLNLENNALTTMPKSVLNLPRLRNVSLGDNQFEEDEVKWLEEAFPYSDPR